jgi:hypothetical protein
MVVAFHNLKNQCTPRQVFLQVQTTIASGSLHRRRQQAPPY